MANSLLSQQQILEFYHILYPAVFIDVGKSGGYEFVSILPVTCCRQNPKDTLTIFNDIKRRLEKESSNLNEIIDHPELGLLGKIQLVINANRRFQRLSYPVEYSHINTTLSSYRAVSEKLFDHKFLMTMWRRNRDILRPSMGIRSYEDIRDDWYNTTVIEYQKLLDHLQMTAKYNYRHYKKLYLESYKEVSSYFPINSKYLERATIGPFKFLRDYRIKYRKYRKIYKKLQCVNPEQLWYHHLTLLEPYINNIQISEN